eukprot:1160703-Pelagomonas_calceolata.AAC.1
MLPGEVRRAVCGLASQLWVPGGSTCSERHGLFNLNHHAGLEAAVAVALTLGSTAADIGEALLPGGACCSKEPLGVGAVVPGADPWAEPLGSCPGFPMLDTCCKGCTRLVPGRGFKIMVTSLSAFACGDSESPGMHGAHLKAYAARALIEGMAVACAQKPCTLKGWNNKCAIKIQVWDGVHPISRSMSYAACSI